jgi:hypothetical protein
MARPYPRAAQARGLVALGAPKPVELRADAAWTECVPRLSVAAQAQGRARGE